MMDSYFPPMRRRTVIGGILAFFLVQLSVLAGYAVILLRTELARNPDAVLSRRLSPFLEFGRSVDRAASMLLRPQPSAHSLSEMHIVVADADWRRLEQSLPEGGLYNSDVIPWIPATVSAEGRTWSAHLRTVGTTAADWSRSKRSYELTFAEAEPFHDMERLLLLLPDAHDWLNDMVVMRRSKALGLVHPQVDLTALTINGRGPMVYLREEARSAAMASRQGRGGDAVLYGVSPDAGDVLPAINDQAYWQQDGASYVRAPADALAALLELSRPGADGDPEYLGKLGHVMDLDRLAAYLALRLSMGNALASASELQLLYRSDTGRFEPVARGVVLRKSRSIMAPSGIPLLDIASRVPFVRSKAQQLLNGVLHDAASDERFLADQARDAEAPFFADREKVPSNRMVRLALGQQVELLKNVTSTLHEQVASAEVLVDQRVVAESQDLLLAIDINARGPVAAEFLGVRFPPRFHTFIADGSVRLLRDTGDGVLNANDVVVPTSVSGSTLLLSAGDARLLWPGNPAISPEGELLRSPHRRHRFFLTKRGNVPSLTLDALPLPLIIGNAVTGGNGNVLGTALIDETASFGGLAPNLDRRTFLARYPIFRAAGSSGVVLSGNPVIEGIILVPPALAIMVEPGTHMRMGSGASIVAFGSVTMLGNADHPIRIGPAKPDGTWGTVAIVDAAEGSDMRYVQIDGGRGATVGTRVLPASLVFASSPGSITQVTIRDSQAASAIAVSRVFADIRDTTITGSHHESIHIEHALAGRIEDVTVAASTGSAIALIGSPIALRNAVVDGSADACVYASERAAPLVEHSRLQNCTVGIRADNGGHVVTKDVTLVGNTIGYFAGGGAPSFGAGSIVANDTLFIDNVHNSQEGSGGIVAVE